MAPQFDVARYPLKIDGVLDGLDRSAVLRAGTAGGRAVYVVQLVEGESAFAFSLDPAGCAQFRGIVGVQCDALAFLEEGR
jgi:hypothetical protein